MSEAREGLVVSVFGRRLLVETQQGEPLPCQIKGRELRPVCGDRVRWQPQPDGSGLVLEILPRHSLLNRHDARHGPQPLAANLDRLLILTAAVPAPEPFLVDRYLVAAEAAGIPALLAFNKLDLPEAPAQAGFLDEFAALGYPTFKISARTGTGLPALRQALRGHLGAVVGQSGVGKSALLNALMPAAAARIGEISQATDTGRHTTTVAALYHLPDGGELIDSPGVRGFHLTPMPPRELARCFVEFRPFIGTCRFSDCLHSEEPGCTVKTAVENSRISPRRYESYRLLCRSNGLRLD